MCPDYLGELSRAGMDDLPDEKRLRSFYPVTDMASWFRLAEYVEPWQRNRGEMLLEVLRVHCGRLVSQEVTHLEVMLTHMNSQYDDFEEQCRLMDRYRSLREEFRNRLEISYLYCAGRTPNSEKRERQAARCIALFDRGYVQGYSLAGDESACRVKEMADIFSMFRDRGLPVEIHAGEWGGPDSVWDALEYGFPRRIGHGVAARKDPVLMAHLADQRIHLEICPTSNLLLTDIRCIRDHPIRTFFEKNVPLSVNTDDPGHFGCTMESEFTLLETELGFTESDFGKIYEDSLSAAFSS